MPAALRGRHPGPHTGSRTRDRPAPPPRLACAQARRTAFPDTYAIIFLLRLHLEHLVRQRLSSRHCTVRHLPPPLDIPPDMLPPPPPQLQQQQQQGQQKQKQHKGSGSAAEANSGGAKDDAKEAGPQGRAGGGGRASGGGEEDGAEQAEGSGDGAGPGPAARLVDSAPDVLCCPISHSLMRMPVVTPSGTTYDFECIHRCGAHA